MLDLTEKLKARQSRITAGRFLQCLALAKGSPSVAARIAQGHQDWVDRDMINKAFLAAVAPITTTDYPYAYTPIGDAFLSALRSFSVPRQLANLRRVPMLTRIYADAVGIVGVEVAESAAIPVLKGNWSTKTLTPRKFAGIVVQTDELVASTSPTASAAIADDLAEATAEAENFAFCNPETANSVLHDAPNFSGTGTSLAQVDADIKRLVDLVPGAFRPGAAFVMTKETATFLALLRGSAGVPAYEDITPQGGLLLGLPVLITSAAQLVGSPPTRTIGLLSPSAIFWADDSKAVLTASRQAALKMDDAATATPGTMVSMFRTNATAMKALLESSWYARSGSGAFFVSGY